jgi:hypothetical protein
MFKPKCFSSTTAIGHLQMLGNEDHKLLCDLVAHNGQVRMPVDNGAAKQCARHLVGLGCATIVPISETFLALEITPLGHMAKVLADFGIWSPDCCAIEPQPSEADGTWRIKVSTVGKPPSLIDVAAAAELVGLLEMVGATDIGRRFQTEVERARRYMDGRLRVEI